MAMAAALKPEWSKPGVILFAAEVPANEEAFAYALAQAIESQATLVLFHAWQAPFAGGSSILGQDAGVGADLVASLGYIEPASLQRAEARALAPLACRARAAGVHCRVVVRQGDAADQILEAARETGAGRIVVGTHARGHIGKLLIGSVAESVLRRAHVPVLIVGPEVTGAPAGILDPRIVLCAVSRMETGAPVVAFAAEIADRLHARLILQHVIRAQECKDVLAHHCVGEMEGQLVEMVPMRLRQKVHPQPVVVPGEPAQKLIDQSRALNADLIVMGAYGASTFSAISRHGVVYRVMAEAQCPVLALSPAVLETGGAKVKFVEFSETYLAGVI
jgi:nucleotide-binding universal stress UspA family protein